MKTAIEHGLHSSPWTDPRPGAHVARAARYYMHTQVEAGHGCPITMTFAAVPSLRTTADLARDLGAEDHRPRLRPAQRAGRADKQGLTIGMAMTEKQGGSDVRANTTRAFPLGAGGAGRGLRARRPQVLRLGADVRRLPGAGAGAGRPHRASCCRAGGRTARKNPMQVAAPEAQDGQRLQRVERDRTARRAGLDGRRGRPRRAHHHRDGRDDALRLHDRLVGAAMRMAVAQALHHCRQRSAFGTRADRPAADAERARRSRARERRPRSR